MLLSIGFVILTRLDMKKAVKQFIIVAGSLAIALLIPFLIEDTLFEEAEMDLCIDWYSCTFCGFDSWSDHLWK